MEKYRNPRIIVLCITLLLSIVVVLTVVQSGRIAIWLLAGGQARPATLALLLQKNDIGKNSLPDHTGGLRMHHMPTVWTSGFTLADA